MTQLIPHCYICHEDVTDFAVHVNTCIGSMACPCKETCSPEYAEKNIMNKRTRQDYSNIIMPEDPADANICEGCE